MIVSAIMNYLLELRDILWSEPLRLGTGLLVGAFLLIPGRRLSEARQEIQDALSARVERSLVNRASDERGRSTDRCELDTQEWTRSIDVARAVWRADDLGVPLLIDDAGGPRHVQWRSVWTVW
jgi:hypothetical protein